MKMKNLLSLALAGTMALSLCGCGGSSASTPAAASSEKAAEEETIVLGVISPNTGSLASYGYGVTTGVKMAVDEVNANGGVLGKQIMVVEADDQGDAAECLNAFNSLVSQGVGLIVGSVTSGCTSAVTGSANEEGVCMITPSATADSITTEDDYIFRACYADSFQGKIAAAFALQNGYSKLGVVYCAADTYSKGLYDSFAASCAEYGLEIVAVESTASMDVQDYTNQFGAMVSAGCDLVYAPYYYDVIGPYLVSQARAAGYTGIIMGADGYDGTTSYTVDGADLTVFNDVYWTNHYYEGDPSPIVKTFVDAYTAKYGTTPICQGALGYDCVMMYVAAIEAAGSADPAAVRDALASGLTFECVTGTFQFDETGTPVKGAAMITFTSDGSSVGTDLVTTITELP